MSSFFESELCKGKTHCHECRVSLSYRKGIVLVFDEPKEENFDCPFGRKESDFPSIQTMTRNVLSAASRAINQTLEGKETFVPRTVAEERFDICLSCEHIRGTRCRVCGCFLDLKTKVSTEECPEGKWQQYAQ